MLKAVDYTKTVRLPAKALKFNWNELKTVKRKEMRQWIKINQLRVVI